jgi:hypothetical protein
MNMEKGYIKINMEEGKTPSVEARLVNNTLWLAKWEIARLFGCYNQKVEMNLRSIFNSKLLWENEVTHTYRYTEKGIEKQGVYYNMEVLIFLSYRIGTIETKIFRDFVNHALRKHLEKKNKPMDYTIVWIKPPCYNRI